MLSRSLRKEVQQTAVANMPQKVPQQMAPALSKSPKPVNLPQQIPNNAQIQQQQNFQQTAPVVQNMGTILERGELFYDEHNEQWLNVQEGQMKNQFGLLGFLQRMRYSQIDTILTKGIDLMTLGLPMHNRAGEK